MRRLFSILHRLAGDHRWHIHLTKDGWVDRRYDLEKGCWEYRDPSVDDVEYAEYLWAIK